MQTIKFYTLGCKANQYDTQSIREKFLFAGFKEIDNARKADVCLVNTCTVTHRADSDSLNLIRRVRRENPKAKIIVTGCLAELDSDKIRRISKNITLVKNRDKENILGHFPAYSLQLIAYSLKGISSFAGHTRAFLKIQDGCDNFCAYCKVPLVRGSSRSRPKEQIVNEAKRLVENGFKEIVLTGICLGAYKNLVELIGELEKIGGLSRIRLSSIEAADVSEELIEKIAQSDKLCRHLHIPLQSGDDEILKKMNRKYCQADYLSLIRKIKRKIPQVAITTDCLVGFPGETEDNFCNTLDLIKKIMPLKTHIFPYSARPGTSAANFKDKLSSKVIKGRICRLAALSRSCGLAYKKKFLGKKIEALIEGRVKKFPEFWEGYTRNYLKVIVSSRANLKNKLINCELKKAFGGYILAEV